MKLHRYYVHDLELTHDFWLQDKALFHQWTSVLRYQTGREVVLFNNQKEERLYKITKIGNDAVHLELVTEMVPKTASKDVYLCFSLLKKDKSEWILQKGTELGVNHFVPILSARTEKTGFNIERAQKIVIEASEQCGRSDVPKVREPLGVESLIKELSQNVEVVVAEQGSEDVEVGSSEIAILIGPEGGWSDNEKELFKEHNLKHIAISKFTLRAETAAITAVAKLV